MILIINKYIKIKCLRRNTLDIYKYNIFIYDKCNKLVFKGVTNEMGYVCFKPSCYEIYKIVATEKCTRLKILKVVCFNKDFCDTLIFTFDEIKKYHLINFKLVDKYYGLPIENES